jgi:GT2 family glycosyltransferase
MILSVVIVNWNTKDLLRKCLKSVYFETPNLEFACPVGAKQLYGEIFVVDNASNDGSVEMIKKEFPEVRLIANKNNLGFAKACNQAIKKSGGKYVLLLNPDTKILGHAIEKSVKFMESRSDIGILGSQLLNPDGTIQPSCRTFPTLLSQVIILLKLHNLFPNISPIRKYYMLDFSHNEKREADQVMGAFFLIQKKVIDKIGLLDNKYWIWFEEVDFCKRAKLAGFKTYFWPEAQIIHEKAASFSQVLGVKKQFWLNNSMLRYFKKFHSLFSYFTILCLYPGSLLLAMLAQLILSIRPVKKKKYL